MIPADDPLVLPVALLDEDLPPSVLPLHEDVPTVVADQPAPPRMRWGALLVMLAFMSFLVLFLIGTVVGIVWILADPIAAGLEQLRARQEQLQANPPPFIPGPENIPRNMDPSLATILIGRNPPTDQEVAVLRQGAKDYTGRAKAATEAHDHHTALDAWTNLGKIRSRLRAWSGAADAFAQANKAAQSLLKGDKPNPAVQLSYARTALLAAQCYHRCRLPKEKEAELYALQVLNLGQRAMEQRDNLREYQELIAQAHTLLALLPEQRPEPTDRDKHWQLALGHRKALVEKTPQEPRYRFEYARLLLSQGERLSVLGRQEEAYRCFQEAGTHFQQAKVGGRFNGEGEIGYAFTLLRQGQGMQAVREVHWLENGLPHNISEVFFGMARIHAQASVTADVGKVRQQEYRKTALRLLERLVGLEYFRDIEEFRQLKEEPDLEPLRQTEEYQRLLKDVERQLRPRPLIET